MSRRKILATIIYSLLAMATFGGVVTLLWAASPTGSPVLYTAPDIATIPTLILNNYLRLGQQGSDPATPASSTWNLYTKSGGLFLQNSAGTVFTIGLGTGYTIVQDEGLPLTGRNTLNLAGAGVSCVDNSGCATPCDTVVGGGGSAKEGAMFTAATTANINLSAPGATHDGVTLAVTTPRMRFLVWQQSTATQNGLYTYEGAATPAVRTTDADAGSEFVNNMAVAVQPGGTVYGGDVFRLANTGAVTLGSSNITFTRYLQAAHAEQPGNKSTVAAAVANGYIGADASGNVAYNRIGSFVQHTGLSNSSQITVTARQMGIEGSSSAVDLTTNPQILAGINGQEVQFIGTHATNTVKLDNGNGLRLCGNTGSVLIGLNGAKPSFRYNTTLSVWEQMECPGLKDVYQTDNIIVADETRPFKICNPAGTSCKSLYVDSSSSSPSDTNTCSGATCANSTVGPLPTGGKFRVLNNSSAEIFVVNENGTVTGLTVKPQVLMGAQNGAISNCPFTIWSLPVGRSVSASSETEVEDLLNGSYTIRNLRFRHNGNIGSGETYTVTYRKNQASTALTCSIVQGAGTGSGEISDAECADTTNSFTVVAGDRISVQLVCSGGTSANGFFKFSADLQ